MSSFCHRMYSTYCQGCGENTAHIPDNTTCTLSVTAL